MLVAILGRIHLRPLLLLLLRLLHVCLLVQVQLLLLLQMLLLALLLLLLVQQVCHARAARGLCRARLLGAQITQPKRAWPLLLLCSSSSSSNGGGIVFRGSWASLGALTACVVLHGMASGGEGRKHTASAWAHQEQAGRAVQAMRTGACLVCCCWTGTLAGCRICCGGRSSVRWRYCSRICYRTCGSICGSCSCPGLFSLRT
mmetsp:Transcript_16479/g.45182  ORF Transcript_16479/g.45182 Transcript_16479/m.45182 type:complete len:202 (-) Transcript_16479:1443-2048(-)